MIEGSKWGGGLEEKVIMVEREGKKGLRWGEGERREYMMGGQNV